MALRLLDFSSQTDTQQQLESMSAWKSSRLMTFDSQNSHIKTHFNEQVVVMLREVSSLVLTLLQTQHWRKFVFLVR
jgi:hypothetical protein